MTGHKTHGVQHPFIMNSAASDLYFDHTLPGFFKRIIHRPGLIRHCHAEKPQNNDDQGYDQYFLYHV